MKVNPNPAMLTWARERAGLTPESVAEAIKAAFGGDLQKATEGLRLFEAGRDRPTHQQLERLAEVYFCPPNVLYAEAPPPEDTEINDFRSVYRHAEICREHQGRLDGLLRMFSSRHRRVHSLLTDYGQTKKLGIADTLTVSCGVEAGVLHLRKALQIGDDADFWKPQRSASGLFKELRRRVEGLGIFVFLAGDMGSCKTTIPVSVFRSFAIADDVAPFIVVNSRDLAGAHSFTLLHELVHVYLGESGVSGQPAPTIPGSKLDGVIEEYCNEVASEILTPRHLMEQWFVVGKGLGNLREQIRAIANKCCASQGMIAYRLHRSGLIDDGNYLAIYGSYNQEWENMRVDPTPFRQEGTESREPLQDLITRLGEPLVALALSAVRARNITPIKGANLLGIRLDQFEEIGARFTATELCAK